MRAGRIRRSRAPPKIVTPVGSYEIFHAGAPPPCRPTSDPAPDARRWIAEAHLPAGALRALARAAAPLVHHLPDDVLRHLASFLCSDDVARLRRRAPGPDRATAPRRAATSRACRQGCAARGSCTTSTTASARTCAGSPTWASTGCAARRSSTRWSRSQGLARRARGRSTSCPSASSGGSAAAAPPPHALWPAPPRAAVHLNARAVHDVVRRALVRRLPCVQVSLYRILPARQHSIILPHALRRERAALLGVPPRVIRVRGAQPPRRGARGR